MFLQIANCKINSNIIIFHFFAFFYCCCCCCCCCRVFTFCFVDIIILLAWLSPLFVVIAQENM